MIDSHMCDECGTSFTSHEKYDGLNADVLVETTCDTVDGQYTEWQQIRCPKCNDVVLEW